jgi:hypothetical protein
MPQSRSGVENEVGVRQRLPLNDPHRPFTLGAAIKIRRVFGWTTEGGVWGVWTRMAQAAQVFHVQVADAGATECRSHALSIKLRSAARMRNGAHID